MCSRCGKVHKRGYRCREYHRKSEDKKRYTYKWTKKALQIKEDACYMCEVCKEMGIINPSNLEVHHIVKLRDSDELWLDDDNLICLCNEHHRQAEEGEIKPEYLRELHTFSRLA